ncbi:F0F1 ATP synthase subunit A [Paenibacillus senegalensis]|uniref:F0F1 ATP synthase subunit A n=1 Tax=Paenibacillus senegalensis TaxID=1465766 RepID=UPI000287F8A6|nr:F0F1 ATP synthase subunit A [Paenibacillus senegalensis]
MHQAPVLELGGFNFDLSTIGVTVVTFLITFIVAKVMTRNLSVENPSKMQNFMEWVVEFVQGIATSSMPLKKAKAYVSLGMTLIMFIFIANILGLPFAVITEHPEPVKVAGLTIVSEEAVQKGIEKGHHGAEILWWKSPTADISVTLGLALVVFFLIHFLGLKLNTKHYLKHYMEPYAIFFPLNILKEVMKPITLAIRLYANIFAGEILISTIIMAGVFGIPLLAVWQGFSIFIGAIQAFLFTVLTMVYISQATIHEEH